MRLQRPSCSTWYRKEKKQVRLTASTSCICICNACRSLPTCPTDSGSTSSALSGLPLFCWTSLDLFEPLRDGKAKMRLQEEIAVILSFPPIWCPACVAASASEFRAWSHRQLSHRSRVIRYTSPRRKFSDCGRGVRPWACLVMPVCRGPYFSFPLWELMSA